MRETSDETCSASITYSRSTICPTATRIRVNLRSTVNMGRLGREGGKEWEMGGKKRGGREEGREGGREGGGEGGREGGRKGGRVSKHHTIHTHAHTHTLYTLLVKYNIIPSVHVHIPLCMCLSSIDEASQLDALSTNGQTRLNPTDYTHTQYLTQYLYIQHRLGSVHLRGIES